MILATVGVDTKPSTLSGPWCGPMMATLEHTHNHAFTVYSTLSHMRATIRSNTRTMGSFGRDQRVHTYWRTVGRSLYLAIVRIL
jgi:hypothetical protein